VKGRATLGDFLRRAQAHLEPATRSGYGSSAREDPGEVGQSLLDLVTVLSRYAEDVTAGYAQVPARRRSSLTVWAQAGAQAQDALARAAAFLARHEARLRPHGTGRSELARRLDAAAASLSAGRDLLQSHFAPGRYGAREPRTEWAAVIGSEAIGRALLGELSNLARRAAPQVADAALSPGGASWNGEELRYNLNAACQWMWIGSASIQAADEREPVTEAERDLLALIPASALPPRRVPEAGDATPELCEGITNCAERARRAAWAAAGEPSWSALLSAASMRRTAASCVAASHHCNQLLSSLADSATQLDGARMPVMLSDAAERAGQARGAWLAAARALEHVTTDTPVPVTWAASEASDLAFWTGRLLYADADWTPGRGPSSNPRPPEVLASDQQELTRVVDAIHHACDGLAWLGRANLEQVRVAGQAGRILVPTRSLPDSYDMPHPFTRAPVDRAAELQSACRNASHAAETSLASVGTTAEQSGAPSRYLTTAREAAAASLERQPSRPRGPGPTARPTGSRQQRGMAGPLERSLQGLGIEKPDLLRRAVALDRAGERLLLEAAAEGAPEQMRPGAAAIGRSEPVAAVVTSTLASGDARASSLHPLVSVPRRQPDLERNAPQGLSPGDREAAE
jgi:hypothetical protein